MVVVYGWWVVGGGRWVGGLAEGRDGCMGGIWDGEWAGGKTAGELRWGHQPVRGRPCAVFVVSWNSLDLGGGGGGGGCP